MCQRLNSEKSSYRTLRIKFAKSRKAAMCASSHYSNYEDALGLDRIAERIHLCKTL